MDYRLLNTMGMDSFYSPLGSKAEDSIKQVWNSLTGNAAGSPATVTVAQGRTLPVKRQAKQVAEMTFSTPFIFAASEAPTPLGQITVELEPILATAPISWYVVG